MTRDEGNAALRFSEGREPAERQIGVFRQPLKMRGVGRQAGLPLAPNPEEMLP